MSINTPKNLDTGRSCIDCKYLRTSYEEEGFLIDDFLNCLAFPYPEGIPQEIYDNGHEKPRPDLGQTNNTVFTKRED